MEAVLNVENLAYCKIEIEDANMPASFNLIDHIIIHEGFGIAVPTLTLYLFDQTGTLQNDMNLVQGSKCSLSLAHDSKKDRILKRTFSLWGIKRGVTSAGPHLEAVFIMDVPKWTAGVYCENFRTTSSDAMQRIASSAGLRYDGPSSTDDKMNWLNINQTRSSFSEDIAMRGFANDSSCMSRVLTMDNVLRYKDLFDVLKKDHKATLLLNSSDEGQKNPFAVMESQESSMSGVMAHWFNYGAIQHEHSLDQKGQQTTDRILAPVLGDAFPISDRVKALISDAVAARVTYTGWDPGTEPNPGSNVHENYERAFYQNLRGLGLFSEKMKVMVNVLTDISSFDCVKYFQSDPVGHQMFPSKSLNGKYLVAGKTIRIKNGHVYTEVFDIIRPYVSNPGKSEQASGAPKTNKVEANAGAFDLAEDSAQELAYVPQAEGALSSAEETASEMDRATDLANALNEYADAVPAIPDAPMDSPGAMSPSSKPAVAQAKLKKAVAEMQKDDNSVSQAIDKSKAGFDPKESFTVKRVSAAAVKTSANETISEMSKQASETGVPPTGPEGLSDSAKQRTKVTVEKPVLDRYTANGDEIKEKKIKSMVSPQTAADVEVGDTIGDVQKGGVFVEDFQQNGQAVPDAPTLKKVSGKEQEDRKGINFVYPASMFGLGGKDVVMSPKEVAEHLIEFSEEREDPEKYMKEKGPKAYQATFGTKSPTDAEEAAKELKRVSTIVASKFGDSEVLAEANKEAKAEEVVQKVLEKTPEGTRLQKAREELAQKKPSATIKYSPAGLDFKAEAKKDSAERIAKSLKKGSNPDYAQAFDFQYGESGVSPLLETVVSKGRDQEYTEAEALETRRQAVSWALFTRVGNNEAKATGADADGIHWEFPHVPPFKKQEEGNGETHNMPDEPSSF